jgi:FtsH-binding integral membrane protein
MQQSSTKNGGGFLSESKVFARREENADRISANYFNFIIGITLCWGFLMNWQMVQSITPEAVLQFGFWPFIIAYFISCFVGIYLFNASDKPWVSFIGYNLVVVPFGCVINIVVAPYDPELVFTAVETTGLITLAMMLLGTVYPAFFFSIQRALAVTLLLVIAFELITMFFMGADFYFIDWIIAIIFCGYIGLDWARAQQVPKTVDNAIDCAAALYMDIINLFLRILRIMGRR